MKNFFTATISLFAALVLCMNVHIEAQYLSKANGNCPDCGENEWGAIAEFEIGRGTYVYQDDPSCGGDMNGELQQIVKAYADMQIPGISQYAGPILDKISTELGNYINNNIHGTLGEVFSRWTNPTANCRIIAVVIPAGSKYTGYRLEMTSSEENFSQWHRYPVGHDCGWCKFASEPTVSWTKNGGIVSTVFKNWSHDRIRRARITAFFVPAENTWAPPR